jgi:hypothetical protein
MKHYGLYEKTVIIVILPADKGNATVVMKSKAYIKKMEDLLSDQTYQRLTTDLSKTAERKIARLIKK